jgi:hypothetical protein
MRSIIFIFIAFLLATNNVFIGFRLEFLSIDRLFEFIFFGVFFNTFIKYFFSDPFFKKFTIIVFSLAVVQLFSNLYLANYHGLEIKTILENLFKSLSFIVFAFLFYLLIKKDIWYLKFIVVIHLLICLFAILQHPMSPLASQIHEIKLLLYSNIEHSDATVRKLTNQETHINYGVSDKFRLSGPFVSTTTFSYFLLVTFFFNIYLYFRTKRRIYVLTTAFIILCCLLTQTRSLVVAIAFIIIGLFLFINNNSNFNFLKIISTILLLIISLVYIDKFDALVQGSSSRLLNMSEDSYSAGRTLLWLSGLRAVATHPFGITDSQYTEVKLQMARDYGKEGLSVLDSHNGLINIGINYTIIGYFVILIFFIFIIKYTKLLSKSFQSLFYLFFGGYIMNIFFHNNFIFISDYEILMALMLIPIHYLYEKESQNNTVQL